MTQRNQKAGKQSMNIKVFIRIRPFSQSEANYSQCVYPIDQHQIIMREKESGVDPPVFHFDQIFSPSSTQEEVYKIVANNIIDNAFLGINGTIFCYGQTSSGKTYTCIGSDYIKQQNRGILPRTIDQIQNRIRKAPKNIECKMKISMIQIYNEKIRDLLDQTKFDLKIRSNKSQGIFLADVTEKYILTDEQSYFYISKGIQNRSVSFTNMNSMSSRSHMVITITLHQHDFYTGEARCAKITLVDLAGSQKISRTGAEGKLLQEAKKINTSLSVLGKVINILSEGKKSHVPYRDSKLTRLLQQSLGGNSLTSLIINVSPAIVNEYESLSSLRFGFRAKSIKNQPRINKDYTIPQLLQLLNKAQNKVKDLLEVIKELMKQKGHTTLSVQQFLKLYHIRNTQAFQNVDSDEQLSSPTKSISDVSLLKNNYKSGSQPALLDVKMGTDYFENRKKSATKHSIDEEQKSKIKISSSINLLNINKSTDFVSKKYFTPKREEISKVKSFSKNKKQSSSNLLKIDKINQDSSSDEEMLLDNLVINEIRIGKQFDGKSEYEKSIIMSNSKCTFQSKVYDMKLQVQRQIREHYVADESEKKHRKQISRDTGCRSQSSNDVKQKEYKQKKGIKKDGKVLGRSLQENLQQIKKNLEKIKAIKMKQSSLT